MAAKNSEKYYVRGGYYHVYNRGVEKRIIFQDEQDYNIFLLYLKEYLQTKNENHLLKQFSDSKLPWSDKDKILKKLKLNNFTTEIDLICYCLMPNHFHFLIRQNDDESMIHFMNSLCTRYSMYFNKKYRRVGPLYQGVYKAVLVNSDEYLLQLTKYIHRNPLSLQGVGLQNLLNQHSSYSEYIGTKCSPWIKKEAILKYFSKENPSLTYESFVNQKNISDEIQQLILEEEP